MRACHSNCVSQRCTKIDWPEGRSEGHRVTENTSLRRDDDAAARRLAETFSTETIDALIKDAKATGTPLDGVGGLLNQMTKAVLERSLRAEMVAIWGTIPATRRP